MAQRKPEENTRIQQVLKLVHELTASEQQQLLEQLKFESLRREIKIGIDEADRGELISLEELNEQLDAKHAELLEKAEAEEVKQVKFTKSAARDLDQIYEYIGQDNLDAAVKHRQRLEERWLLLLGQPRIGTKRVDIEPDLGSVTEGNYVIFYRMVQDGIQVVRVLHTAQDAEYAFADTED